MTPSRDCVLDCVRVGIGVDGFVGALDTIEVERACSPATPARPL